MLSNNLKHVLYESNERTVSLEKEIEFIDNYIEFQKIRTEGVKQIIYTKEQDNLSYKIAPLLLITIIENAFKHSTLNSTIVLRIQINNGVLNCFCENDYDSNTRDSSYKIGLENLKKRLQLIYTNKYELYITKTERFTVQLKLELL